MKYNDFENLFVEINRSLREVITLFRVDQFKQLEMMMAQSGQSRAAMRQGRQGHGMQGGGGKRRRPRNR